MAKTYYEVINEEETPAAAHLANVLITWRAPSSVIDLGCATGLYLKPLYDRGIHVIGVENNPEVLKHLRLPEKHIKFMSITDVTDRADLALCLEVLEHLPESQAQTAVQAICRTSDTIVFSAARPGQGGVGHVNCQPKDYWQELFASNDFIRDYGDEGFLLPRIRQGYHMGWLAQNLMVFRKSRRVTNPMRFHVVSLPHTQTNKSHNACAYTMKVFNFCKMMYDLGHEVFHYGAEGSNCPCTEHITVITKAEQDKLCPNPNYQKEMYKLRWDSNEPYWKLMNNQAIKAINDRKQKKDFLSLIGGCCQKPIADSVDLTAIETGIGYEGIFAKYRVFESYSHMHKLYGKMKVEDGRFYDCVIPNYYDLNDYPFSAEKDDYFLYLGRLISRKGITVAVEVCRELGKKLIVAGQGALEYKDGKLTTTEGTYDGVEFVGFADVETRARLMGRAQAVFVPTFYVEPFGGVNVEAQLCGSPVLTTDWGAFPETVEHGVTGYRCRTLEQFTWAAKNIGELDPYIIRQRAARLYSLEKVASMYHEYFSMLYDLWENGWYQKRERSELNWLKK